MHVIDWQMLLDQRRLPDGDRLSMSVIDPNYPPDDVRRAFVRLTLRLNAGMDWWKGVQILNWDNEQLAFAETQDDQGEVEAHAPAMGESEARRVVLWKAKQFGIHTPMYALVEANRYRGKIIQLLWLDDG